MLVSNEPNAMLDCTDTMYPGELHKITNGEFVVPANATVYGMVLEGTVSITPNKTLEKNEYFSFTREYSSGIDIKGTSAVIVRYGFRGQNTFGGPMEKQGRLSYINYCSDSMLIYPPRQGDPIANLLHFPPDIEQDWHTHPSYRMGIVFRGYGRCDLKNQSLEMSEGFIFCMEEKELHRFVTAASSLSILSFHPDSDWGPTDENHAMLNRTIRKL